MIWCDVLDARIASARAELASLETQRAYHLELRARRNLPLSPPAEDSVTISADRIEDVTRRVHDLLASAPDGLTMPSIRGLLHTAVTSFDISAVLPLLISSGSVVVDGRGSAAVYRVLP